MFVSKEQVEVLTGYTVDSPLLNKAQSIVEAFVGKVEGEVDDASDLAQLGKAVAYQAAYMKENGNIIFEQMAVGQIGTFGSVTSFRTGDYWSPYVAPLAVIACRNLSWRRARSIKTGSTFGVSPVENRWVTE